jgi:hypothetical protein
MIEFTDILHRGGGLLGFASPEIAYVYIGSLLVTLLCVIYGLLLWKDWGKVMQGRRPRRVRRGKKSKRPRRRR